MEAWLAQEKCGVVFAYREEPKYKYEMWFGDILLCLTNNEIPNQVKALLKQQKAVKVDIYLTVTKIVQLPN